MGRVWSVDIGWAHLDGKTIFAKFILWPTYSCLMNLCHASIIQPEMNLGCILIRHNPFATAWCSLGICFLYNGFKFLYWISAEVESKIFQLWGMDSNIFSASGGISISLSQYCPQSRKKQSWIILDHIPNNGILDQFYEISWGIQCNNALRMVNNDDFLRFMRNTWN